VSAVLDERFGRDVLLPDDPDEDMRVTPTGDLPTVAGVANVRGALRRRCLTSPGDMVHRPAYGGGVELELSRLGSPARRASLANQLRRNLFGDDRVREVRVSVSAGSPSGTRTNAITIEIGATLADNTQDAQTLTLVQE